MAPEELKKRNSGFVFVQLADCNKSELVCRKLSPPSCQTGCTGTAWASSQLRGLRRGAHAAVRRKSRRLCGFLYAVCDIRDAFPVQFLRLSICLQIDFEEFKRYARQKEGLCRDAFKRLDLDASGTISVDDLVRACRACVPSSADTSPSLH